MYNEKNISRYRKKEMISRALKNRRKGGGIKVYTIQLP